MALGTKAPLRKAVGKTVIETSSSPHTKVNSSEGNVTQSSIPDKNMGESSLAFYKKEGFICLKKAKILSKEYSNLFEKQAWENCLHQNV